MTTNIEPVTLYAHGVHGVKEYKIWCEDNNITILANGSLYYELITEGKAGRSIHDQVKLRINARLRSKLDQGFKGTKEELGKFSTNQLGLARPMLATHLKDYRGNVRNDDFLQPKLDGHRCLMNPNDPYTRAGRIIETIPEIQDSIKIPAGATIDGELYCHGVPLQTISSWAKRRQRDTLRLKYWIYDIVMEDTPYKDRYELLKSLKIDTRFVRIVKTFTVYEVDGIWKGWMKCKVAGYEGAIFRPRHGLYDIGKRSKTLIKVKRPEENDAEYECIDVIPSKWGWGVLVLKTPGGLTFKTPAPGTLDIKLATLTNKEKYIGKYVTCEYATLTKEKIPFHCVATRWREDL